MERRLSRLAAASRRRRRRSGREGFLSLEERGYCAAVRSLLSYPQPCDQNTCHWLGGPTRSPPLLSPPLSLALSPHLLSEPHLLRLAGTPLRAHLPAASPGSRPLRSSGNARPHHVRLPPLAGVGSYSILDRNDSVVTYIVSEHINQTTKVDYKVAYDNVEDDIWCFCRLFQSKGILCRHALTVLRQELVLIIPPKYIIHRWCKDCKQTCASISQPVSVTTQELGSYDDLYKLGHQYFAEVVEFGSMNSESKEYALSIMREIRDKVISYEKSLRDQRVDSHVSTANFAYNPVNEDFTDDALPISLSTKGWDLTQGQSKRSRKKKLATPTVLDTLKKKTKRAYNKRRNATANTINTAVTATDSVTEGTNEHNSWLCCFPRLTSAIPGVLPSPAAVPPLTILLGPKDLAPACGI
ncbi:hypothetical protein HU200_051292 [Digitaria exilis]|uniref:Protein FAR1-RELATED SEQUENCE n=1 Tax=Digitaria exilis TaxID=1010633 RepID=A0A835AQB6_9POAL|nr:hypothetical protein HU200_051292 [Digitaria exilis]